MNYLNTNRSTQFEEHKRLINGLMTAVGATSAVPPWTESYRAKNSKIRIGYVSGDLHEHSCTYLTIPLLRHHNRNEFEIFVYSNLSHEDKITQKLRGLSTHWTDISAMDDRTAAESIKKDSIDILVDLSGHTVANRLGIFFYRPAPIQMSWYGYLNTTGVPQIDYRITDPLLSPEGKNNEQWYTEKLIRIPRCFLYEPPENIPPVAEPPYRTKRHLTFGALHDMKKVSNQTLDIWSAVLRRVPDSKLLFSIEREGDISSMIERRFAARGVPKSQLIFIPRVPIDQFFYLFKDIDIMLDTFPYTSGVSAMHALWMGVPTLTIEGETELFRNCAAVMRWSGLPQFASTNATEFVDMAVYYSKHPWLLSDIRRTCREKPIVNNESVVRNIEEVYSSLSSPMKRHTK